MYSLVQLITNRRTQLDIPSIEAGKCQKLWAQGGLISFHSAVEILDILVKSEQ